VDSFKEVIYFHREKEDNWEIEEKFTETFSEDGRNMVYLGSEVKMEVEIFKDKTAKILSVNDVDVSKKEIYL